MGKSPSPRWQTTFPTLLQRLLESTRQFDAPPDNSATIFPEIAIGGGWATQISMVNTTGGTISGRIDLFNSSAAPSAFRLNGENRSTFEYSIPAGGAFTLAPRDENGESPL